MESSKKLKTAYHPNKCNIMQKNIEPLIKDNERKNQLFS